MGIISSVFASKYPQSIWAYEITKLIRAEGIDNEIDHIYDVPGGVGLVAHNLSVSIESQYHVYDIDKKKIKFGMKYLGKPNIEAAVKDIYKMKFEERSVWLFINSFYMLSGIDRVIERGGDNIDYIIGLFPNIETDNYNYYKENIDSTLNINEMSKDDTISYFHENGFDMSISKDLIYFDYLTIRNVHIRFIVGILFTLIERLIPLKGTNYWVGVFKRKKQQTQS